MSITTHPRQTCHIEVVGVRVAGGAAAGIGMLVLAAGSAVPANSSEAEAASGHDALPLTVIEVSAPPIRVPRVVTVASYPQVRGGNVDLRAVNLALRALVRADQRRFTTYVRDERRGLENVGGSNAGPSWAYAEPGDYRVAVDPKLVSASTVVVSMLLPTVTEAFAGQSGGDQWRSLTVLPSGRQVAIRELFASERGLRVFATEWRERLRRQGACVGVDGPFDDFSHFALTPSGLAVGGYTSGACSQWVATVPYALLKAHLSALGARLVAGVRTPIARHVHLSSRAAAVVFVQALPSAVELIAEATRRVPAAARGGFSVTVSAAGAPRGRTRVTLSLRQTTRTIVRRAEVGPIDAGGERSIVFANLTPIEPGAAQLKIDLTPLERQVRWSDSVMYPIFFTRPNEREGVRGLALMKLEALPMRKTLWPRIENVIPRRGDVRFAVTVKNTGRTVERRVKVRFRVDLPEGDIERTTAVSAIAPGDTKTIVFRSQSPAAFRTARTLWIAVDPAPGERRRSNNATTYPVRYSPH